MTGSHDYLLVAPSAANANVSSGATNLYAPPTSGSAAEQYVPIYGGGVPKARAPVIP